MSSFNTTPSEGLASARQILKLVPIASTYCVDTGKVVIGRCHIPRPPVCTRDGETLQEALLEPRTSQQPTPLARVAGALWRLA